MRLAGLAAAGFLMVAGVSPALAEPVQGARGKPAQPAGTQRPRASAFWAGELRAFAEAGDWLGFRVFLRKIVQQPVSLAEWQAVRAQVLANAHRAGFDLVARWDSRNPARSGLETELDAADEAMQARDFNGAFARYQAVLAKLKAARAQPRQAAQADALYPYVLQSMGRALFGAKRFADALEVYGWIPPGFANYRQVLFERMWSAFRLGRVDLALGAIASQRSAYSSLVLPAEGYLVLGYAYKKLCRQKDLEQLLVELDRVEQAYRADRIRFWAEGTTETRALWKAATSRSARPSRLVTPKEREAERKQIAGALRAAFPAHRQVFLERLKTMKAYLSLANIADAGTDFKPVTQFKDRDELLKRGLEIWPMDTTEEWADEIGHHLFLGESQCVAKTSS